MLVKYHNTVDDLVAFNRYHYAHSPAVKRTKFTSMILVSALLIVGALTIPSNEELSRSVIVAGAVVLAALCSVILNHTFAVSMDRQVRRLCKEGTNKSVICQHELEINDDGLVERTEVNETRHSWQGVERIAESDRHVFIYFSAMMAYIIPKESVTSGDPDQFIARAQQLWRVANPEGQIEKEV